MILNPFTAPVHRRITTIDNSFVSNIFDKILSVDRGGWSQLSLIFLNKEEDLEENNEQQVKDFDYESLLRIIMQLKAAKSSKNNTIFNIKNSENNINNILNKYLTVIKFSDERKFYELKKIIDNVIKNDNFNYKNDIIKLKKEIKKIFNTEIDKSLNIKKTESRVNREIRINDNVKKSYETFNNISNKIISVKNMTSEIRSMIHYAQTTNNFDIAQYLSYAESYKISIAHEIENIKNYVKLNSSVNRINSEFKSVNKIYLLNKTNLLNREFFDIYTKQNEIIYNLLENNTNVRNIKYKLIDIKNRFIKNILTDKIQEAILYKSENINTYIKNFMHLNNINKTDISEYLNFTNERYMRLSNELERVNVIEKLINENLKIVNNIKNESYNNIRLSPTEFYLIKEDYLKKSIKVQESQNSVYINNLFDSYKNLINISNRKYEKIFDTNINDYKISKNVLENRQLEYKSLYLNKDINHILNNYYLKINNKFQDIENTKINLLNNLYNYYNHQNVQIDRQSNNVLRSENNTISNYRFYNVNQENSKSEYRNLYFNKDINNILNDYDLRINNAVYNIKTNKLIQNELNKNLIEVKNIYNNLSIILNREKIENEIYKNYIELLNNSGLKYGNNIVNVSNNNINLVDNIIDNQIEKSYIDLKNIQENLNFYLNEIENKQEIYKNYNKLYISELKHRNNIDNSDNNLKYAEYRNLYLNNILEAQTNKIELVFNNLKINRNVFSNYAEEYYKNINNLISSFINGFTLKEKKYVDFLKSNTINRFNRNLIKNESKQISTNLKNIQESSNFYLNKIENKQEIYKNYNELFSRKLEYRNNIYNSDNNLKYTEYRNLYLNNILEAYTSKTKSSFYNSKDNKNISSVNLYNYFNYIDNNGMKLIDNKYIKNLEVIENNLNFIANEKNNKEIYNNFNNVFDISELEYTNSIFNNFKYRNSYFNNDILEAQINKIEFIFNNLKINKNTFSNYTEEYYKNINNQINRFILKEKNSINLLNSNTVNHFNRNLIKNGLEQINTNFRNIKESLNFCLNKIENKQEIYKNYNELFSKELNNRSSINNSDNNFKYADEYKNLYLNNILEAYTSKIKLSFYNSEDNKNISSFNIHNHLNDINNSRKLIYNEYIRNLKVIENNLNFIANQKNNKKIYNNFNNVFDSNELEYTSRIFNNFEYRNLYLNNDINNILEAQINKIGSVFNNLKIHKNIFSNYIEEYYKNINNPIESFINGFILKEKNNINLLKSNIINQFNRNLTKNESEQINTNLKNIQESSNFYLNKIENKQEIYKNYNEVFSRELRYRNNIDNSDNNLKYTEYRNLYLNNNINNFLEYQINRIRSIFNNLKTDKNIFRNYLQEYHTNNKVNINEQLSYLLNNLTKSYNRNIINATYGFNTNYANKELKHIYNINNSVKKIINSDIKLLPEIIYMEKSNDILKSFVKGNIRYENILHKADFENRQFFRNNNKLKIKLKKINLYKQNYILPDLVSQKKNVHTINDIRNKLVQTFDEFIKTYNDDYYNEINEKVLNLRRGNTKVYEQESTFNFRKYKINSRDLEEDNIEKSSYMDETILHNIINEYVEKTVEEKINSYKYEKNFVENEEDELNEEKITEISEKVLTKIEKTLRYEKRKRGSI